MNRWLIAVGAVVIIGANAAVAVPPSYWPRFKSHQWDPKYDLIEDLNRNYPDWLSLRTDAFIDSRNAAQTREIIQILRNERADEKERAENIVLLAFFDLALLALAAVWAVWKWRNRIGRAAIEGAGQALKHARSVKNGVSTIAQRIDEASRR